LDKILELTGFKLYKDTAYGSLNGIYVNVIYSILTASALVHFFIKRENGISIEEIKLFLNEKPQEVPSQNIQSRRQCRYRTAQQRSQAHQTGGRRRLSERSNGIPSRKRL